jgi:hypothetical protein
MKRNITGLIFLLCLGLPASSWAVPNPTVTGPIPSTAQAGDPSREHTFFANEIVGDFGYVEEEFFIEGTANAYLTPPLATGTIVSSGHPYVSRIVVRRPAKAQRFNGTVILEWLNVTTGMDADSWLAGNAEHYMREGYAWVGVSAQQDGIHAPFTGLRDWNPARYGALDLTDGGTLLDDALCYDVFSQAGQAVMNPVGVDPLGGLQAERIIARGASQSAFRLGIYYNSIQPLANLLDAFMLVLGNSTVRMDLGVPVFKLHTETEAIFIALGVPFPPSPPLQPDTDIHRTWQVAGSGHVDAAFSVKFIAHFERDFQIPWPLLVCDLPNAGFNTVRFHHVVNAAQEHVVRWVKDGTPPPIAPLIETIGPVVARDELGLALGGIRIADLEVPTAFNVGFNSGTHPFCPILAPHIPFDEETLDELYPTHGSYIEQVGAVVQDNLEAGYITRRDARETLTEAARSDFGK